MAGTHLRATDVWGFVAVASVLAVAIWLSRDERGCHDSW